jgi:Protein of unknown function (DUF3099)
MRIGSRARNQDVHMVTQARRPMSEDIAYRQRRYLIMMSFRAVCFGITILLFVNHLGWLAAIPAVFAIFVPYVAVVFANGGREPDNVRGFLEYRPKPAERRILPGQSRPASPTDASGPSATAGPTGSGQG